MPLTICSFERLKSHLVKTESVRFRFDLMDLRISWSMDEFQKEPVRLLRENIVANQNESIIIILIVLLNWTYNWWTPFLCQMDELIYKTKKAKESCRSWAQIFLICSNLKKKTQSNEVMERYSLFIVFDLPI